MRRLFSWYLHQRLLGYALFTAGLAYSGFGAASSHVLSDVTPATQAETVTLPNATRTHTVTVRLPGKVIRRVDHILIARTPRYVFVYNGQRRVLRPKLVHIRFEFPAGAAPPVIAAILGGASLTEPATVTVPVTVTDPGATSTETLPQATTTVTIPPVTTTVTVPTTITVPLPATSDS